MKIGPECIACGSCAIECPRRGIEIVAGTYRVDASRCTECADEGGSRCALACPIECIAPVR